MTSSHSKHIQDALALVSSGEISKVLRAQKVVLDTIISNYQQSRNTPIKELTELKDKLECLFFVFYRVQALEEEVYDIRQLIQSLSNALASLTNSPIIGDHEPYIKNDFVQSLYYLLVLAQLILVCMLQQTAKLYSRDDPTLNLWVMDDHGVSADDCGNNLPQMAGSREEFDTQTWQCTGAKAFCCLVYAVFRQPEVDMDRADPADVEWFLHEASLLRGYSYIRLCIIPVLQALASHDQEMALFLLSVLKELLQNIVKMFCLPVFTQPNAVHERDFPYIFFPPTQAFYTDNVGYYNNIRETGRHAYCGRFGMFMIEEVDTLEDILLCFGALIEVYPSFAANFWPPEADGESLLLEDILQHASPFERSRLSCFDPFLGRLFDISNQCKELIIPTMDFLTDISNAPGNHSRKVCFNFVYNNTSCHSIINWPAMIEKLELVAATYQDQKLASDNAAAAAVPSMDRRQGGLMPVGGGDNLAPKKAAQLTALDMECLLSITKLLHAMLKDIDLAVYFYENLIGTLFALLSCPLFIEVKQEIVGCLTCYARIDQYRAEVWQGLDSSNMLSLYSKTGGIKYELENIESQSGNYYLLDRFLVLMAVLFQHPLPEDLGAGNRVPGVLPYLTFIIDEVLLKAEDRFYSHPELLSFQAQQYKIITRCFLILYEILVRYQVHHVSPDEILYYIKLPASVNAPQPPDHIQVYLSDLKDEVCDYTVDNQMVKAPKPKSPGYFLMLKLLSNSKLTEFIMKYLAFMTADNLKSLEADYIESELGTTLQYFKEVFIITPEHTGIVYLSHHILAKQQRLFEERQVTLADTKVLPIQSHPIYWLEYGCSVCLALMYEVSLRSQVVKYLRQSIDTSGGNVSLTTPLKAIAVPGSTLYDFAQILSNHQFTSILMQILSMTFTTYATNPSVYLYAIKIMEYLAIYHTTNQSRMVSLLSAYPVDTVARLLLDDVYYIYHNIHDRVVDKYDEYHIRLLGCEPSPNSLNPEYSNCSIRQALVELLLASYLPKHYTYSHYFMGIPASPSLPLTGQMTCLDALLNLLSTDRAPLSLLEESPYLAVDVYELLYVFCLDEHSREQVLHKLRQVNFFAVHLTFIAYVMHFDVLDFFHQIKQRYSRNELYAHTKYAHNVHDLQIAINHSAGYVFAMASLELVQSLSPKATVGMLASRQKLMKLLLGFCDNLDFSAERSDMGVLVCNKVLMYMMSSLHTSVTSKAVLPEALARTKGLVRDFSRKQSIAKASASFSAKVKNDDAKASSYQSICYESVDIVPVLTQLRTAEVNDESSARNEIKDTVKVIVSLNLKSRLHAACKHVITASQDLFCMLFYLSHDQVLTVAEDHDRCLNILQYYISALPVVGRTGVGIVGESLARTVLSIIAYAEKQYMVAQQNVGWKYADDHQELWCIIAEKLVDALSNQQSLSDLASRDLQVLGRSEGLSSDYQGLVCLAISRVLALLMDMKQSGAGVHDNDDILNVFIDQKGLYIFEALFPLVTKGAVLWRLASISTISNLLGIIHPDSTSSVNVAAKVAIFLKSSSIWSSILTELAKLLDPEQTRLLEDNQLIEYAHQLVLLGYKLGKHLPGGVDLLYSSGYLTVLCHTSCMGEVITMKNAFLTPKNEDTQKVVLQLFNGIVQSITMLVTNHPLVKDNARLVARFLRKNNGLITYLLRLQDSSLFGVQVLSSVVNLLLASLSSLSVISEKNWYDPEMGQVLVGEIQELLPDCFAWLKIIGSTFLPGPITSHFHLRGFAQGALGNSDVWSEVLRVISAGPFSQSEWEDSPSLSWTAAMQTQLETVMSIFVAISGVFRKYSLFSHRFLDIEVIGSAYLNVVQTWLQLSADGRMEEVSLGGDDWKTPGKKKSLKKWLQGICTIVASNILNTLVIVAHSSPHALKQHNDVLVKLLKVSEKASNGSNIAILTRQLNEVIM